MKNQYIKPEIGRIYTLKDGGEYRCLWVSHTDRVEQGECSAVMIRDKDGWKLTVHGLQQSDNDRVEWDYSTGGHWAKNTFEVWKDSELGPTYMEKSFSTKEEAEEWMSSHEKHYPGWHLRVVEKWQSSLDNNRAEKETMKATHDGYIYKGVHIRKSTRKIAKSWETSWHTDGKVFLTLREAKQYIEKKLEHPALDDQLAAAKQKADMVELGDLSAQHKQNSEAIKKTIDFIME